MEVKCASSAYAENQETFFHLSSNELDCLISEIFPPVPMLI